MATINSLKINIRSINRIMASDSAQKVVDEEGRAMARRAGPNFEYVERRHKWTARGFVQAANLEGAKDEARDKKLTRAI